MKVKFFKIIKKYLAFAMSLLMVITVLPADSIFVYAEEIEDLAVIEDMEAPVLLASASNITETINITGRTEGADFKDPYKRYYITGNNSGLLGNLNFINDSANDEDFYIVIDSVSWVGKDWNSLFRFCGENEGTTTNFHIYLKGSSSVEAVTTDFGAIDISGEGNVNLIFSTADSKSKLTLMGDYYNGTSYGGITNNCSGSVTYSVGAEVQKGDATDDNSIMVGGNNSKISEIQTVISNAVSNNNNIFIYFTETSSDKHTLTVNNADIISGVENGFVKGANATLKVDNTISFIEWEVTDSEGNPVSGVIGDAELTSKIVKIVMPDEDITITAKCDEHTHVPELQKGKPATCDEDGWKDYYACTLDNCNKLFEDIECSKLIEDLEEWKVTEDAGKIKAAHELEFKAEGNTLTAFCSKENRDISYIILAPSWPYYNAILGLKEFNEATGLNISENDVKFYKAKEKGDTTGGTGRTSVIPTEEGNYYASLTVADKNIVSAFSIGKNNSGKVINLNNYTVEDSYKDSNIRYYIYGNSRDAVGNIEFVNDTDKNKEYYIVLDNVDWTGLSGKALLCFNAERANTTTCFYVYLKGDSSLKALGTNLGAIDIKGEGDVKVIFSTLDEKSSISIGGAYYNNSQYCGISNHNTGNIDFAVGPEVLDGNVSDDNRIVVDGYPYRVADASSIINDAVSKNNVIDVIRLTQTDKTQHSVTIYNAHMVSGPEWSYVAGATATLVADTEDKFDKWIITDEDGNIIDGVIDESDLHSKVVKMVMPDRDIIINASILSGIRETGKCGDKATYILYTDGTLEISGEGKINNNAFQNNSLITRLIINEGIDAIGSMAFERCTKLQGEIVLPSGLEHIGGSAFEHCVSITKVVFPEYLNYDLKNFSGYIFGGCSSLKEVVWPETGYMKSIPFSMFEKCVGLERIVLPEGVEYIGPGAFLGCMNVKEVVLPSTLTEIGGESDVGVREYYSIQSDHGAFEKCYSLEDVIFPNGNNVKIIGISAFLDCYSLKYYNLSDSIELIKHRAFEKTAISGDLILDYSKFEVEESAFKYVYFDTITLKPGCDYKKYPLLDATGGTAPGKLIVEDSDFDGTICKSGTFNEIYFPNGINYYKKTNSDGGHYLFGDTSSLKDQYYCDIKKMVVNGGTINIIGSNFFARGCSVGELVIEKDFNYKIPISVNGTQYDLQDSYCWPRTNEAGDEFAELVDFDAENFIPKGPHPVVVNSIPVWSGFNHDGQAKPNEEGLYYPHDVVKKLVYGKNTTNTIPFALDRSNLGTVDPFDYETVTHVYFENKNMWISTGTYRDKVCYLIDIPDEVKGFGNLPFAGSKMKYLLLPRGLERIEENLLYYCFMENIWIPKSVKEISEDSFAPVSNVYPVIENIYYEGTKEEWEQIKISWARNVRFKNAVDADKVVFEVAKEDVLEKYEHEWEFFTDPEYHGQKKCKKCLRTEGEKEKHTFEPVDEYTHKCTVCGYVAKHTVDIDKAYAIYDESGTDSPEHVIYCTTCEKEYRSAHENEGSCMCARYGYYDTNARYIYNDNTGRLYVKGSGVYKTSKLSDYICENVKYIIIDKDLYGVDFSTDSMRAEISLRKLPKLEYLIHARSYQESNLFINVLNAENLKCVITCNTIKYSMCPYMRSSNYSDYIGTTLGQAHNNQGLLAFINDNFEGFDIIFDANGGSAEFDSKTLRNTEKFGKLPEMTALKKGCAFKGWYTQPEGGEKITSDVKIDPALFYLSDDNRICAKLYAQWSTCPGHDFVDAGESDSQQEKCSYCGIKNINYKGYDSSVIAEDVEYTGNGVLPNIQITGLTEGVDYSVLGITNINPGEYTAKVVGTGGYDGERLVRWKIVPGTPNVISPEVFAKYNQKLGDIELVNPADNIEGTWKWNNPYELVKGLGACTYKATFIPKNTLFWKATETDITINAAKKECLEEKSIVKSYPYNLEAVDEIIDLSSLIPEEAGKADFAIEGVTFTGGDTVTDSSISGKRLKVSIAKMESPVDNTATTINVRVSTDYYEDFIAQVKITRSSCEHSQDKTVIEHTKLPGCETSGEDVIKCTDCGEIIESGIIAKPIGHNFQNGICTRSGCGLVSLKLNKDIEIKVEGAMFDKKAHLPEVTVSYLGTDLEQGVDYITSVEKRTAIGTYDLTIRGIGKYTDELSAKWSIYKAEGLWCQDIADQIYTGKPIKPVVEVYCDGLLLKEGKDYTLTYKNNTKVADKTAEIKGKSIAPSVTITGKGNYSDKITLYFSIVPADISVAEIDDITAAYTKKSIKILPAVLLDGKKLKLGTDYVISTTTSVDDAVTEYTEAKKYSLNVVGKGNYSGAKAFEFTITNDIPASKVSFDKIPAQKYDKGREIKPIVGLNYGGKKVTDNFEIEYENNTEIGTATVIAKAKDGSGFAGTTKTTFKISGASISSAKLGADGKGKLPEVIYNGKAWEPELNLYNGTTALIRNVDYTVKYAKNVNVGTATVTVTGKGGYSGNKNFTFKIGKYDGQKDDANLIKVNDGKALNVEYEKGGVTPKPVVKMGDMILAEKIDYTLSYVNNKAKADAGSEKSPAINIVFKGNISGKKSVLFSITSKDIDKCSIVVADKTVSAKANDWKQTVVTITDINDKKLVAGTDYSKAFEYYADEACKYEIKDTTLSAGTTVFVKVAGINNYAGTQKVGSYRISKKNISSSKASIDGQFYTGKEIRPTADEITVTVGSGKNSTTLRSEEDYVIVPGSYKNNIDKGTASLMIQGRGDYFGTKEVKFKIGSKKFLWWLL